MAIKYLEANIGGTGFELVAGHIDKDVVEQINEGMDWYEVEDIAGHWSEHEDIIHEYWPDASFKLTCNEGTIPKLKAVNAETNEINLKDKGYMMLAISFEKGHFGSVLIPADVKVLTYRKKTYRIGNQKLEALVGFSCGDEELEMDMSESSTRTNFTEINIYNRETGTVIMSF